MPAKKSDRIEPIASFDDMGLHEDLLRGIHAMGFDKPSEVQSKAIVPVTSGRDIVIQAQSGTGKTGTFSIATLQQLDMRLHGCQALVLSPTRELAQHTGQVITQLGDYMDVRCHVSIRRRC